MDVQGTNADIAAFLKRENINISRDYDEAQKRRKDTQVKKSCIYVRPRYK